MPMKAKILLPWRTSKRSTMNAQKTLFTNRLMVLSQT